MKREKQINFKDLISEITNNKEKRKSLSQDINPYMLTQIEKEVSITEESNNIYFDSNKSIKENLKELEKKWSVKNVQLCLYNLKTQHLFEERKNEQINKLPMALWLTFWAIIGGVVALKSVMVNNIPTLTVLLAFVYMVVCYFLYLLIGVVLDYRKTKKFEKKLEQEKGGYYGPLYAMNHNYLKEPLMKAMLKNELNQEVNKEDFVITNLKDFKVENPSLFPIKLKISRE